MYAKPSLRARALGYLSRREHSRAELHRKLVSYADHETDLNVLLNVLQEEGYLSDARFAESVAHRRAARCGVRRIINELKQHELDATLIEQIGADLQSSELTRAKAIWRKKYGNLPTTSIERARQTRFLAMRGFAHATIVSLLSGCDEE